MKQTKKNEENHVHLYGYINGVDIRDSKGNQAKIGLYGRFFATDKEGKNYSIGKDEKLAVNFDLTTSEAYKVKNEEGKEEYKNKYTKHDVVMFTADHDLAKQFAKIQKELAAYEALPEEEKKGAKRPVNTVSMDGFIMQNGKTIKVGARDASVDLNVPQEKEEPRNSMTMKGNIGSIDMKDNFAVMHVAHNYPEREGKERREPVWVDVRVDSRMQPETFKDIQDGKIKVGDFIKFGGQIHNRNFEVTKEGQEPEKRYEFTIDARRIQKLVAKEAKTEKVEVKEEPKAAPQKAAKPSGRVTRKPRQEPVKKVNAEKKPAKTVKKAKNNAPKLG